MSGCCSRYLYKDVVAVLGGPNTKKLGTTFLVVVSCLGKVFSRARTVALFFEIAGLTSMFCIFQISKSSFIRFLMCR